MARSAANADPEAEGFAGPVEESVFEEAPYDPTMDPASPRWDPKKYFAAQPKELIVIKRSSSDVLGDPTGEHDIRQPVAINGYALPGGVLKGVPVYVPKDFAQMLIGIGAAYRVGEIQTLS